MKPPKKIFVDYDPDLPSESLLAFSTAKEAFERYDDEEELPLEVAVYEFVGFVKIKKTSRFAVVPMA